jgi:WD40 repeat protein
MSADGRLAVSACTDHTLKVWDLGVGRELCTLQGHTNDVYDVAVSADGRRAASASEDHTVRVWDLQKRCHIATFSADAAVWSCALDADGVTLVAADDIGQIIFLQLEGAAR